MGFIFRQFFESQSSTYTYIVGDARTREAIIIDPVKETFTRDRQFIDELDLKLKYILETHVHADHITSASQLREATGAQIVLGAPTQVKTADILLKDKEILKFGDSQLLAMATPGHTDGCTSFLIGSMVFTGDALMIRGCGRTDFQQGSNETLFQSVREKLFVLPDETLVYPGHDYKGRTCSSIGEEKKYNPRLKLTIQLDDFSEIMDGLNLDPPKKIEIAVPANLRSGMEESS